MAKTSWKLHRPILRLLRQAVGRADHLARAHAAAGQQGARHRRPVVAAAVALLIFGVRPNSPHTITDTSLSRPRSYRSSSRARQAEVEHRQVIAGVLERGAVGLAVPVPAAVGQRHHADAGLDQPPGRQEVVVQQRAGVAVAGRVGRAAAVTVAQPRRSSRSRSSASTSRLDVRMFSACRVNWSAPSSVAACVDLAAQAVEAGQADSCGRPAAPG